MATGKERVHTGIADW